MEQKVSTFSRRTGFALTDDGGRVDGSDYTTEFADIAAPLRNRSGHSELF